MDAPVIAVDEQITQLSKRVNRKEMFERHRGVEDISANGINIVLQDTGLDTSHPWVKQQTNEIEVIDFTKEGERQSYTKGHGTMVTDLATRYATGANVEMHVTIPGDSLQPYFDSFGKILNNPEDYDVLVMSWAYPGYNSDRVNRLINEIADKGVIPIAASGNNRKEIGSPATARKCISVGALTEDGKSVTNFSSWNNSDPQPGFEGIPEISAIGKSVVGANADNGDLGDAINDKKTVSSGTSFSCPFVANLVADAVRRMDEPTVEEILEELEQTAVDIEKTSRDGLGRVDDRNLLYSVTDGEVPKEDTSVEPSVFQRFVMFFYMVIKKLFGSD